MPSIDFSDLPNPPQKSPQKSLKWLMGIFAVAGVIALGNTFAANISLNNGAPVEFGQGQTATTACDSSITFTPKATFFNSPLSGEFSRYVGATDSRAFEIADKTGLFVGQSFSSSTLGSSDVITYISDSTTQDTGSGYAHFPNPTNVYAVHFSGPGFFQGPTEEQVSFSEGGFYFSSIALSHVNSTACSGKYFTINLYGTGSEPLATYSIEDGGTQFSSGDGQFVDSDFTDPTDSAGTLNISHPTILSTDVKRITMESSTTGIVSLLASYDAHSSDPSSISSTVHFTDGHPSAWINSVAGLPNITDMSITGTTPGINGSLNFVPSNNDYIAGNLGSRLDGLTRVSVEMWINIDPSSNPNQSLFSFDTGDSRGHYVGCGYTIRLSLGFIGSNTCNGETFGASTSGLTAGWHHVVWIASTGARTTQKIYVDGASLSLSANTTPDEFGEVNVDENPRPNIGNGKFRVPGWGDINFSLGALRIYSGEISAAKVSQDYNELSSRL